MSRLRFLGSLVATRLSSSHRICRHAAVGSARLLHHRNGVQGFRFFHYRLPLSRVQYMSVGSVASLGTLSALVGGMWYFKEDAEEPVARKLTEDLKEEAMKKRFEEWMIWCKREYENEEEKARRYEIFKKCVKWVDKLNAESSPGGPRYGTTIFCDRTEEELPFPSKHRHMHYDRENRRWIPNDIVDGKD